MLSVLSPTNAYLLLAMWVKNFIEQEGDLGGKRVTPLQTTPTVKNVGLTNFCHDGFPIDGVFLYAFFVFIKCSTKRGWVSIHVKASIKMESQ